LTNSSPPSKGWEVTIQFSHDKGVHIAWEIECTVLKQNC
jgi:hypothetical protein